MYCRISSADANFDLKCAYLSNGMDNFMCPSQCEQLCKSKPAPEYPGWTIWKKSLQDSSSNTWVKIQKPKPWDDNQRQTVLNVLPKLGSAFLPPNLNGIYRASRDPDPFNPGNPAASLDGQIILYDRAFSSGSELNRILTHEVIHVLIASSLKSDFVKYKNEMGWSDSTAILDPGHS
jgi:hypothetical protein